ncbi:MAG: secretin N-terminal domain-containing protein [Opitutaceae bacterium]
MRTDSFQRSLAAAVIVLTGLLPARAQDAGPGPEISSELFSFRAENAPIKQALSLFARANKLNIVADLDILGEVTVEFQDLPLDYAMRALLDANGYYFVKDGPLIRVRKTETRLFQIDYINATRAGEGSNAVQISSGGGASSGGSGGGGGGSGQEQGSTMTVTNTSNVDFWKDLAGQLATMLSEDAKLTVNSLSGTITVTDSHQNIGRVAQFLESVGNSVVKQVDLEVQIYEVAFTDTFQLGIDWSRVGNPTIGTGLIVRNPLYGGDPSAPGVTIGYDFSNGISAVLEALSEQGDITVVSKPRLRTLNNQPAVVRVGQDLPVFVTEVIQSPGTPPVITQSETIQVVTVGTVLSITPQISDEGLITLDITPAVSRLVRIIQSASGNTDAPVIDIRQASSLVRVRDGDTVVMGGLVQDGETTTTRKIPILGDIPLLGKAFSGEYKSTERSELIFFVTPRIIKDLGEIRSVEVVAAAQP